MKEWIFWISIHFKNARNISEVFLRFLNELIFQSLLLLRFSFFAVRWIKEVYVENFCFIILIRLILTSEIPIKKFWKEKLGPKSLILYFRPMSLMVPGTALQFLPPPRKGHPSQLWASENELTRKPNLAAAKWAQLASANLRTRRRHVVGETGDAPFGVQFGLWAQMHSWQEPTCVESFFSSRKKSVQP